MTDERPSALDYETVKEFFYTKLAADLKGKGRLESAIFHTVQFVFESGAHRNATLLARIGELEILAQHRRDRIERLHGLCKSASGWLLDAGDIANSETILDLVGDMEPK